MILSYFNVVGANRSARTGQSIRNATQLIKVAVGTALGKRPKMNVCGTNCDTADGIALPDYIHVSDSVAAIGLPLESGPP